MIKHAIKLEARFHFFWHDYRSTCSYFLLLSILKDLFFPLSGVIFYDGFTQSLSGAFVLTAYFFALNRVRPFRESYLNSLEKSFTGFELAILLVSGFSFDSTEDVVVNNNSRTSYFGQSMTLSKDIQQSSDDWKERRSVVLLAL